MVTINNKELRGVYHYLVTIDNIVRKEVRKVNGNKYHLDKLKIIKDHRNYIAHGKRDSGPPPVELTIDQIASTLDGVIREIEK